MPIIKYPSVPGGYVNRIDQESRRNKAATRTDVVDLSAATMDFKVVNLVESWRVDTVSIAFSNATARDFAVNQKSGLGIVSKANDFFWVAHREVAPQAILLEPGFYSDPAVFTAHVESKLNANSAFADKSITFTVTYSLTTKLFTITPSSGEIIFYYENKGSSAHSQSLAAPVMGFMADVGFATSITGTTPVDIGTAYTIFDGTGSTLTSFVDTDPKFFDVDTALEIVATTGPAVIVTARVTYTLI